MSFSKPFHAGPTRPRSWPSVAALARGALLEPVGDHLAEVVDDQVLALGLLLGLELKDWRGEEASELGPHARRCGRQGGEGERGRTTTLLLGRDDLVLLSEPDGIHPRMPAARHDVALALKHLDLGRGQADLASAGDPLAFGDKGGHGRAFSRSKVAAEAGNNREAWSAKCKSALD
jgi:hypothetical protein